MEKHFRLLLSRPVAAKDGPVAVGDQCSEHQLPVLLMEYRTRPVRITTLSLDIGIRLLSLEPQHAGDPTFVLSHSVVY